MKLPFFALTAIGLLLASPDLIAQQKQTNKDGEVKKEETVIIKKNGAAQTTVEIKNGNIYVNGEKVASAGNNNIDKKIIIDSDKDLNDPDFFKNETGPDFSRGWDNKASRKAMLGVITNADKSGKGAYIQQVTPGSAAKDAGLKEGDVITQVDGKEIDDPKSLVEAIESHEAGDKVVITYERNGKTQETNATLSKMAPERFSRMYRFRNPDDFNPDIFSAPFAFDVFDGFPDPAPKLGITAEDRADENGVRVLEVKPNSAAEDAGLKKDDVITKLGDEKITSIDDLQGALRHFKTNEKIKLQYSRGGKLATTDILLPRQLKKKDL